MSAADNDCWHHIWLGELRQNILFNRCPGVRRASTESGVRHGWIEMHNTTFDWLQLQAVSDMWKILQWEKLTRNNHCRKNGFLYRQIRYFIAQLPQNSLFWPRNYREIRHFDREITAKFAKSTILQLRGTAKFGKKNRAKHRAGLCQLPWALALICN